MVRTRIAPSPTGYPHIGTIYQALFDFAYAKKKDGAFLLRIEDTDRERFVDGAEEMIKSSLEWFGIVPDESPWNPGENGPYRQSERLEIYQKYAQELIDRGHAYFAYYPKAQSGEKQYVGGGSIESAPVLEITQTPTSPVSVAEMLEAKDWIVRMKIPKDTQILVRDEIRGEIGFDSNTVTEQVLIKSDGYPTYHLASVVDDHLMGITHVVRGEEWLTSSPKHWLLYEYFGWEKPKFYHTPVLRNPDKSKLSKRQGHTSVDYYREAGFLPEAILNFLALLGWSHPEEKEIFSMEEFISLLELEDIKPVAPIFDIKKLEWMNGEYIRKSQNSELKNHILEMDPSLQDFDQELLERLIEPAKTRMRLLSEFKMLIEPFVSSVSKTSSSELKSLLRERFETIGQWTNEAILETIKSFLGDQNLKFPDLYMALIGVRQGLPLPEVFEILGRERTLSLLK